MARGHAWLGVCMAGDMRDMHTPGIRSMRGRYAFYWNAFLYCNIFAENCMKIKEIEPGAPPLDPSL